MKKHLVAPSLLAADFLHLGGAIDLVNESLADWFHLDVMDGQFVPNISYGMPVIEAIKRQANKPLDVHLMIEQPEKYISTFREIGADVIEDIVLFGLVFFKRLQTHNDYNIITKLTKKYNIMHFIDK